LNAHLRYLAALGGFALLLGLVPLLNFAVIWRSGEFDRLPRIVAELHATGAIYGSGLHDVRGELPLEIVRHRRPEIVALGSSRALDVRQEFFTRPFACACGGMDSIDDGEVYGAAILERARPRVVLFALDFWWFTTPTPPRRSPMNLEVTAQMSRDKILRPLEWLREGTVTPGDYLRLLAGERDLIPQVPRPKIGAMAIKRGLGVRADGSLLSGVRVSPLALPLYAASSEIVRAPDRLVLAGARRAGAHSRFGPDNVVVPERLAALDRALAVLESQDARVILLLPPVAPPVAQAMARSGRHRFIDELDREVRARGREYYNFHDITRLGSDVCEFGDAIHSGNVAYLRMLKSIVDSNPRSALASFVDPAQLARDIARDAGGTLSRYPADGAMPPEIDFLRVGCRRGT
jgi:hypothetical protein